MARSQLTASPPEGRDQRPPQRASRSRWRLCLLSVLLSFGVPAVAWALPSESERFSEPAAAKLTARLPVLAILPPPSEIAQSPIPATSFTDEEPSVDSAPSVIWLLVMPAIPITGGVLIYLTRVLLGTNTLEARISVAPEPLNRPLAPPSEAASDREDGNQPHSEN